MISVSDAYMHINGYMHANEHTHVITHEVDCLGHYFYLSEGVFQPIQTAVEEVCRWKDL